MARIVDLTGEVDLTHFRHWQSQPMTNVQALIIHHTAGGSNVGDIVNTFQSRHVVSQFVIDPQGNIFKTLPDGYSGRQIIDSPPQIGLNNENTIGVELIAADDKHVTPAEIEAVKALYGDYIRPQYGLTPDQVFGHGVVNPYGHRQATEGLTATNAIRDAFGGVHLAIDPNSPGQMKIIDPNSPDPLGLMAFQQARTNAGQSTPTGLDPATDLMARTMLAEARGEGPQGMAAVGWVAQNRADDQSGRFPGDVSAVLTQPGQFAKPMGAAEARSSDLYPAAYVMAQAIRDHELPDITKGSVYFWNPKTAANTGFTTKIAASEPFNGQIGNHVFYGAAKLPPGPGLENVAQGTGAGAPAPTQVANTTSGTGEAEAYVEPLHNSAGGYMSTPITPEDIALSESQDPQLPSRAIDRYYNTASLDQRPFIGNTPSTANMATAPPSMLVKGISATMGGGPGASGDLGTVPTIPRPVLRPAVDAGAPYLGPPSNIVLPPPIPTPPPRPTLATDTPNFDERSAIIQSLTGPPATPVPIPTPRPAFDAGDPYLGGAPNITLPHKVGFPSVWGEQPETPNPAGYFNLKDAIHPALAPYEPISGSWRAPDAGPGAPEVGPSANAVMGPSGYSPPDYEPLSTPGSLPPQSGFPKPSFGFPSGLGMESRQMPSANAATGAANYDAGPPPEPLYNPLSAVRQVVPAANPVPTPPPAAIQSADPLSTLQNVQEDRATRATLDRPPAAVAAPPVVGPMVAAPPPKQAPAHAPGIIQRATEWVKGVTSGLPAGGISIPSLIGANIKGLSGPGPFSSRDQAATFLTSGNWHMPSFDPQSGGPTHAYMTDPASRTGAYLSSDGTHVFTYSY